MTQQQETVTKQKNPLRIEQGRKLVEYNRRKKEELKQLNKQITKQDDMVEHKPRSDMNNYVYAGGLSLFALAIGGYLLYSKFKKPEQTLIDVPAVKASTEPKKSLKCSNNFYRIIYKWLKIIQGFKRECLSWCSH